MAATPSYGYSYPKEMKSHGAALVAKYGPNIEDQRSSVMILSADMKSKDFCSLPHKLRNSVSCPNCLDIKLSTKSWVKSATHTATFPTAYNINQTTGDLDPKPDTVIDIKGKPLKASSQRLKREIPDDLETDQQGMNCHLYYDRRKQNFLTMTTDEIEANQDIIICSDKGPGRRNNRNCYVDLLQTSGIERESCHLETRSKLDLCVAFYRRDGTFYHQYHCRIQLQRFHSHGIVFDEYVYFSRECDFIPMFLTQFQFHDVVVFPFLSQAECLYMNFAMNSYHSEGEIKNDSVGIIGHASQENVTEYMPRQVITHGLITPICVMEKKMKNAQHCKIPFENWKGNGADVCPPPGCHFKTYDPSKQYDCIPYIEENTCNGYYMHEGAMCIVNRTDKTYSMCKAITPNQIQIIAISECECYSEFVLQCLSDIYPHIDIATEDLNNFAAIPLDSMHLTPLKDEGCLLTYDILSSEFKKAYNDSSKRYIVKQLFKNNYNVFYVQIAFHSLGLLALILNCYFLVKMTDKTYKIVSMDIYVIFLVVSFSFHFVVSVVELVIKICAEYYGIQIDNYNCVALYLTNVEAWCSDLVFCMQVALCYDRTFAIARPLEARSKLTIRRAKIVCSVLVMSTFFVHSLFVVGQVVENVFYSVNIKECEMLEPSRKTPDISTLIMRKSHPAK